MYTQAITKPSNIGVDFSDENEIDRLLAEVDTSRSRSFSEMLSRTENFIDKLGKNV